MPELAGGRRDALPLGTALLAEAALSLLLWDFALKLLFEVAGSWSGLLWVIP